MMRPQLALVLDPGVQDMAIDGDMLHLRTAHRHWPLPFPPQEREMAEGLARTRRLDWEARAWPGMSPFAQRLLGLGLGWLHFDSDASGPTSLYAAGPGFRARGPVPASPILASGTIVHRLDSGWKAEHPCSDLAVLAARPCWLWNGDDMRALAESPAGACVLSLLAANGMLCESSDTAPARYRTGDLYADLYLRAATGEVWGSSPAQAARCAGEAPCAGEKPDSRPPAPLSGSWSRRRSTRAALAPDFDCQDIEQLLAAVFHSRLLPAAGGIACLRAFALVRQAQHTAFVACGEGCGPASRELGVEETGRLYRLYAASLGEDAQPGAIVVIGADVERKARKYGCRALGFALTELGCAYQSLYLLCAERAWGGCAIGRARTEIVDALELFPDRSAVCLGAFALFRSCP